VTTRRSASTIGSGPGGNVNLVDSQEMYCESCAAVVLFEQPADESDEWACTLCGEAFLVAPLTLLAVNLRDGRIAPQQRRAA
jgi:hypothetical protein